MSIALAVCLLAGNALLFSLDGRRATGCPADDFARFLTGKPVTASLPPAVEVGRWLDENATDGRVAVAAGVDERSHQTVALMAGMPDLLHAARAPAALARARPPRRRAARRLRAGVHAGVARGRRASISPAYRQLGGIVISA